MILFLLAAVAVVWWTWGRSLTRQQLVAAGSGLIGLWLLVRGVWAIAIPMFLPGIWLLVQQGRAAPRAARMDADEARRILGVGPDAGADAIRAAHRRLVTRVHPDQGGTAELAGRVNAARDLLLAQLGTGYRR